MRTRVYELEPRAPYSLHLTFTGTEPAFPTVYDGRCLWRVVKTSEGLVPARVEQVGPRAFKVSTATRCDVKGCLYFARCARLEAERARALMEELRGGVEVEAARPRRWTPERVDEAAAMAVVERIITA